MPQSDLVLAPNLAAIREALRWGCRDALREQGELLESLGVSLREAAYRGDDITAKAQVAQARLVVIDAVSVVKELERVNAEREDFNNVLPARNGAA
jgi:hypothetical protein